MKNITKKESKTFVDQLCEALVAVGAKLVEDKLRISSVLFELETVVGKLDITVSTDNVYCYTMFSRFENVEQAKDKFVCNPYSGKYNTHVGKSEGVTPEKAVEICMIAINLTLAKEVA